mgnify:CR=1 FL=1
MAVTVALPAQAQNYPTDLISDIAWSAGTSTVADIQAAFSNGRANENVQLGTSLPGMVMPTQSAWDAKSNSEKVLWLVNSERVARGVLPLQDVDTNVISVAQNYANFLLANNAFGHTENGQDPWQRLESNPAIAGHHDFLGVSENILPAVAPLPCLSNKRCMAGCSTIRRVRGVTATRSCGFRSPTTTALRVPKG